MTLFEMQDGIPVESNKKAKQTTLIAQNKRFINITSPTGNTLRGVWLESLKLGFAVGNAGTILQYNGDVWTSMTSPIITQLNKVTSDTPGVTAPNTIGGWAVGQAGVILRYDTNTNAWTSHAQSEVITSQNLNGMLIWDANTAVFAVGATGVILYWNGTVWAVVASGTTEILRGIGYDNQGSLWICGDNGTLLKSIDEGVTWQTVASGITKRLNYIWFSPSRNIGYAVGEDGMILKIIPSTNVVSVVPSGLDTGIGSMLYSIELTSDTSGFLVGNAGNILYWDGANFYQAPSPTSYALVDVAGSSINVVFAVGVDGTILKLMAETYSTTLESRGVEITPLKEEFEESQIFTDYAITNVAAHTSRIFDSSRYKYNTFYVKNTLDQAISVQVMANRINSVTGAVTVGAAFSVAATTGIEARTIRVDSDGYLPYYYIVVTAAIAPLSGNVNAYAIGRN